MQKQIPIDARVLWQVEEYIAENAGEVSGFSLDAPTFGDHWIARQVRKHTAGTVDSVCPDEWDVIATKRYMLAMDFLQEMGFFGSTQTYRVRPEFAGAL